MTALGEHVRVTAPSDSLEGTREVLSSPSGNERLRAESQIKPSTSVVWRRVEESIVLVHLGTNKTYELNLTAGRLWELLDDGSTYGDALAALRSEFDVSEEQLQLEAQQLVALLLDERLAEETSRS
jgi:hypothetical protein